MPSVLPTRPDEAAPWSPRILVVDDRAANLLVMSEILKDLGYPVVTASSGGEALRILMQHDFAVILLDVNMPGVDGFEVSRLIRARERSARTPIIFVTAISTGDKSVAEGYSLGAVDYVFSPVVPEILRAKVSVFVELERKTRELEGAASRLEALVLEKETLLREVHHRVKNNLQVISSLINMQSRQLKDSAAQEALDECRRRVKAIALIHEKLYEARDYAHVPFSEYAKSLAEDVFRAANTSGARIRLEVDVESIKLSVDKAIPCGLILNELITNSLKHAFRDATEGRVKVELRRVAHEAMLAVSDDGTGIAEGFDPGQSQTLGMQLVSTLVKQLGGRLDIVRDGGARFCVTFRADNGT